jgi:hypothetical protein
LSKIEVNTVEPQCGTTLTVGKADTNLRTGGNSLQAADGGNLISQSGTAITLGASGDSINLASGASQTGFGRTGTVDWITTPKTATFTAVSGEGYFANTTGGAFTMNLPAGVAGAIVSVADYAGTWQTNSLTVTPNGTDKIGSVNTNAILNTEGQSVTFVFVDSTQGWVNTMDSTSNVRGKAFITATGGTPTQSGDFEIRTFTGPGTFEVTALANNPTFNSIDYLVIAGGGGASNGQGGGGGAGGFRESHDPAVSGCYTASPLATPTSIPVSVTSYPIVIGAGGDGANTGPPFAAAGSNGSPSSAFSITSTAGGGGGYNTPIQSPTCGAGGSGGGSGEGGAPGAGNTPPTSPAQGTAGGAYGVYGAGSGGGGAIQAGFSSPGPARPGCFPGNAGDGGVGGSGAATSISGSAITRAGGGGGGRYPSVPGSIGGVGGAGGGGESGGCGTPQGGPAAGTEGTVNTGSGGGVSRAVPAPANGGSGIVIIRYKRQ